ncbi:thiamine-phosphate kinase [Rudaeicoccus suwonensis]|uniref:Thiamine-monophosphate kinase n=1 Tax=Rudaeicoccus suwonensis TaxID=657409 RepID=A0A561E9C0_9MICO|nr:thiamine-phosphate kinase [Rudaeicoccus suwonensis]TWE12228.1 thiamine-phosphate kinase [Rudaeicoccus suwonensis]
MSAADEPATLGDINEDGLLAGIFPGLPTSDRVLIGPGDDAALLQVRTGATLATTDTMVLNRDWRDEWSTGYDVGHKLVTQNVADVAAMGGRCTGLLVTLVADAATSLTWVRAFNDGLCQAAVDAGTAVLGGDLSSAPVGVRMVSITALGEFEAGVSPVRRSGARVGDVVAVSGGLGRAAAGLLLLQRGREQDAPHLVDFQRRPVTDYAQGPAAARSGATAMLDISDGLVRDAGRIAAASGVLLAIDDAVLRSDVDDLAPYVGDQARQCVLAGGEEHTLLATFPSQSVPAGWRVIGSVEAGSGVTVGGEQHSGGGWDHFSA